VAAKASGRNLKYLSRKQPKMIKEPSSIDAIVTLMRDNWNLPSDCNDGELYTYAEHLADRIRAGDDPEELGVYLKAIQIDKLDMPDSSAYRVIAERAAGERKRTANSDEAALPEMPKKDAEPYDGSPV
jgi:hypothetical protein